MLVFGKAHLLLAAGSLASALSERQAPACTIIAQRVPWTNLTTEEKAAYIGADLCLMNAPSKTGFTGAVTRWDDLQWPHVHQTTYIHNVGAFLPFHRYYMTVHERMIRQECGYTGRMPYWDEVAEVADLAGSDLWKDENFGGNGVGANFCVATGPFANLTLRWELNNGVSDHCLSRSFSQTAFAQAAQTNIDRCNAIASFATARNCWEESPHRAGHGGVGKIMGDSTLSPGDPVFYLHHSYLDKLWWEWQNLDPANRLYDIAGQNLPGQLTPTSPSVDHAIYDYINDNGTETTLQHTLYMDGLSEIAPNITINDIMDLNGPVICSEYINV